MEQEIRPSVLQQNKLVVFFDGDYPTRQTRKRYAVGFVIFVED